MADNGGNTMSIDYLNELLRPYGRAGDRAEGTDYSWAVQAEDDTATDHTAE